MKDPGWVEGQNIVIEWRFAGGEPSGSPTSRRRASSSCSVGALQTRRRMRMRRPASQNLLAGTLKGSRWPSARYPSARISPSARSMSWEELSSPGASRA